MGAFGRNARRLATATVLAVAAAGTPAGAGKSADIRVKATTLLNEGVAAYNRGEYPLAVEKLKQSSAVALNSFRAHFYLGLALLADRRPTEAEAALEIALDLEPSNLAAHVAMGDAHLKEGDTDEAMASYARTLELRSEYPQGLDGLGRVYESRADDDRAIEYFKRAIASNKGYAEAYGHLGHLYLRLDRLGEAVRLLQEAVSIRADFAYGYNALAVAYARLGLRNEAVVAIQKAIELEPHSPEHWTTVGQVQLDVELTARAESSFRKALEIDAAYPEAREGLAEVARRKGDYDAALHELDTALADTRLTSDVRQRLVKTRAGVEAERIALGAAEAESKTDAATPATFHRLAAIHASRHQWSEAAELEARAQPQGVAREHLAYYLAKAARHQEAHALFSELAREAPRAALEVNDGIALAGLGNDEAAIAAYDRALALDPKEDRAQLYRGNAFLRLGRRAEAAAAYRSYIEIARDGAGRERVRRILEQVDAASAGTPAPGPGSGPQAPPPPADPSQGARP